ncbi:hypothetical protein GTY81_01520 [Streptomyces sp. SID8366]|uniref:hypothetical protein n=1 Tax=unclassified Streptomyces TaxID=2593676 RepID=UPI000DBA6E33|nr:MULTISPECIES: hypothetical protein [unclassified Streptomyces]MYU02599.1 hypothetical protein [Streptomyces sp. SID8366]MYU63180.1 hypothetical protein [Streptomyces sp. SID69]RAJ55499.1 hypothetical protein K376_04470 [Streptomyces sp. PsTaAH-130]
MIADGDGVVIARAVLAPAQHTETGGEQRRDLDAQRRRPSAEYDKALRTGTTHGARVRLEWGEDSHLRGTGLGPVARTLVHSTRLPVLLVSPPESGQGE